MMQAYVKGSKEAVEFYKRAFYAEVLYTLAKYPKYAYIKDRQLYIKEKDGRLYFDMKVG